MTGDGWFITKGTKKVTKDTKKAGYVRQRAKFPGRIDACRVMAATVSLWPS